MSANLIARRFSALRRAGADSRKPSRALLLITLIVAFGAIIVGDSARKAVFEAHKDAQSVQPRGRARFQSVWAPAVVFAGLALFAAYWLSYPRTLDARPTFNSPRESIGYYLTQRAVGGHGFSAPLQHFEEVPREIGLALTPRDAANLDGAVVPKDFAGTMLLYAAVMRIHPALVLAVTPLFALLGAWALMRITGELFGWQAGFVAFCCWGAFPPLWISASYVFIGDLPALAFMLLAVLMFVRYWREPSLRRAALASAFFGASILFRYPNVLLVLPFVIALVVGRRVVLNHAAVASLAMIPFAMVVLAFNQWVYGDPFTTGFHLGAELIEQTVNYSGESFFRRRPDVLAQNLRTYIGLPVISVPVALSLVASFIAVVRTRADARLFAVLTLATFCILLAYYGQQDAWGFTSPQVNASFLRYMLPGFALMMVFGAWLIWYLATRFGPGVYAVPAMFIVIAALYVQSAPGGVREVYTVVNRSEKIETQVTHATEPHAVVAVRIMDKVIFPERQTLTLTYAIRNEAPVSKNGLETWDHVASPERFAEVALAMNARGIPVYLLPDGRMGDLTPYQEALKERGYYLRRIREVEIAPFYKVSRDRTR